MEYATISSIWEDSGNCVTQCWSLSYVLNRLTMKTSEIISTGNEDGHLIACLFSTHVEKSLSYLQCSSFYIHPGGRKISFCSMIGLLINLRLLGTDEACPQIDEVGELKPIILQKQDIWLSAWIKNFPRYGKPCSFKECTVQKTHTLQYSCQPGCIYFLLRWVALALNLVLFSSRISLNLALLDFRPFSCYWSLSLLYC